MTVQKDGESLPISSVSDTRVTQNNTSVNTDYMQNSQEDAPKKIESRKDVDNSVQSQESKNWFGDWRKNAVIYKDKLTASNNLDEIVLASTNYINEDLKHQRKDNIVEFARGEVLMQIGNNKYNAKVIVGLTKNNQMLLYDIVKFKKDIFKIKKEDAFTDQNVSKEVSRHYASSDKMISQNDSYVNNNYMQNSRGDASAKKAPIWFTSRGLQLPKLVQTIIDANKKIPQDDSIVNTNSMQNFQEDAQKKIESRKDDDDSVQTQNFKNWFGDWRKMI